MTRRLLRFLTQRRKPSWIKGAKVIRQHFHTEFYLSSYPDIQASPDDPVEHYLAEGWRLGYDPCPWFSSRSYLEMYPDVAAANVNPFVHYCLHGRVEGRQICVSQSIAATRFAGASPPPGAMAVPKAIMAAFPWTRERMPRTEPAVIEKEVETVRPHFDVKFYRTQYADALAPNVDPVRHYITKGWTEGFDPSPDFSTSYYLDTNPDIGAGGIQPFVHYLLHGKRERRDPTPYHLKRARTYRPLVSVIVPCFNHARFLNQRMESIFNQSYDHIELILLDDASSDDSTAILDQLADRSPFPVRKLYNRSNSGNAFSQWEKGISIAQGELIWICESDDFCEPDFLSHMVRHFADRGVMIAFGRIQFCDEDGAAMPGLDQFRERAEPGIWSRVASRPAAQWFRGALGINNVIANVGGCIFRRQRISARMWQEARKYRIAGDWFLFSHLARGGKIVFDPSAVAYFRQHPNNTSAANFNQLYYYKEHEMIFENNCRMWGTPESTLVRFVESISYQYKHYGMEERYGDFDELFPSYGATAPVRSHLHILLASLGFTPGGGELFPIHLGNALVEAGLTVSLMALSMSEINEEMLSLLDPRIAVYDIGAVRSLGISAFLKKSGVSLIHSHMASCDSLFFNPAEPLHNFPYVVSMHGSHDVAGDNIDALLFRSLRGVSHWVYTADKNLKILDGIPLDRSAFSKIPNAVPRDPRPFPKTREELGIDDDTVVVTLVARGIKQKGWRAAVAAFRRLRRTHPDMKAHLLLVGTGPQTDKILTDIESDEGVTFLGFQSCINGLYRISDCALVPSRFDGESFPLCVIQALQEHTPIIATDIGEIRNMITEGEATAGILIENLRDSECFFDQLYLAMVAMMEKKRRMIYSANAVRMAEKFDMGQLVKSYCDVYEKAIARAQDLQSLAS
ncbi:MAG: glycosyltransferase [Beijerinckiaceae bacterium]|nr:glycosyltransferase [Beijerinckiaceae bacterium]MCI0734896.1 glycosyltransferase [Beijerinckiaceae bacterium]